MQCLLARNGVCAHTFHMKKLRCSSGAHAHAHAPVHTHYNVTCSVTLFHTTFTPGLLDDDIHHIDFATLILARLSSPLLTSSARAAQNRDGWLGTRTFSFSIFARNFSIHTFSISREIFPFLALRIVPESGLFPAFLQYISAHETEN